MEACERLKVKYAADRKQVGKPSLLSKGGRPRLRFSPVASSSVVHPPPPPGRRWWEPPVNQLVERCPCLCSRYSPHQHRRAHPPERLGGVCACLLQPNSRELCFWASGTDPLVCEKIIDAFMQGGCVARSESQLTSVDVGVHNVSWWSKHAYIGAS